MSMGGARRGAGRPKGSLNKKTQEIVAKAASEGVTPLEVMLEAMRSAREAGDMTAAAGFAKDAAPYIHPRLANVEANVKADVGIQVTTHPKDEAI